jgi:hypothetical protein
MVQSLAEKKEINYEKMAKTFVVRPSEPSVRIARKGNSAAISVLLYVSKSAKRGGDHSGSLQRISVEEICAAKNI